LACGRQCSVQQVEGSRRWGGVRQGGGRGTVWKGRCAREMQQAVRVVWEVNVQEKQNEKVQR